MATKEIKDVEVQHEVVLKQSTNNKDFYVVSVVASNPEVLSNLYLTTRIDETQNVVKFSGYDVSHLSLFSNAISNLQLNKKIKSANDLLDQVKKIELQVLIVPWHSIQLIKQFKLPVMKSTD